MTREELIDQLAFLRGWYGSINERERSGRVGEILLLLDSIVDGHDIRMTLLDTLTTHRCRDHHR
ncbi:hypothetical protein H0B56_19185 [Haloechinothrix sp. YIM 98757]|uniref:Uncharacterized protein n=1 Tax=Haloechinothrix aidingensis TaxID=2752311 RepID=A0A838AEK4_9PSEU|nr:hypothetical protein [Haloechinothrix aidingensis]MBA0127673.1 hypothetical protein [Haloechinothrix aidingensis]